jgi:predicted DNA-binding transcriptional regulator AlpA
MVNMENGDDLISISEAARVAGTSRNGIYVGIKRGELTPVPVQPKLSRAQVEEWAQRLARRRALIALGVLSDKSPLVDAPTADDYDVPCPACDRLATVKPPQDEGEQTAFRAWSVGDAADYPAACGWCGWRSTT